MEHFERSVRMIFGIRRKRENLFKGENLDYVSESNPKILFLNCGGKINTENTGDNYKIKQ